MVLYSKASSDRPDLPTRPPSLFLSLIDQLPDPNATQILKCEDAAASSFFRPACAGAGGGGRVGAPGHHRFAVGVFPPSTCHSPNTTRRRRRTPLNSCPSCPFFWLRVRMVEGLEKREVLLVLARRCGWSKVDLAFITFF